jgi:hypothetical protein
MARIALSHLTFVGIDVEPATIDFGPKLTVIYGASDTGKSFIADSIDFAMGSSSLRSIRESEPYSHILLGIIFGDESLTLVRALNGGTISIYDGILKEIPSSTAVAELKARHTKGQTNTISAYLLKRIGIYGKILRKSLENKVVELTLRQLAPFFVVHEGQMVALRPPYHPGGRTDATAELSLLRVLLEGDDDSGLEALVPDDVRKVSKGKYEVLQQVLSGLYRTVEASGPADEIQHQLDALENTIAELNPAINDVLARRQSLIRRRDDLADDQRSLEHRVSQMMEITARFTLLRDQYQSDLARLEAIQEAGNVLGFFQSDVCLFCGAAANHQNPPGHAVAEAEEFSIAVVAEQQKTADLLTDLQLTLADLEEQVSTTRDAALEAARRTESARDAAVALDGEVAPQQQELAAAYAKQSQVTHMLATLKQIEEIEALASTFAMPEGPQDAPVAKRWPSLQSLNTLSAAIKLLLDEWGIETGGGVAFDVEKDDLLVDGRPRHTRGKGMRSMIHAGFTLGLAEYCEERGLPHPGVTVLDSPLVTYRQPETASTSVDNKDEYVSFDVAAAFYRYLDIEASGQTVVIENTTPPALLSDTAVVHHFTKQEGLGRYGFFPNR